MSDVPTEDFEREVKSIPGLLIIGNQRYWCLSEPQKEDICDITPELVAGNPESFTFKGFEFSLKHPAVAGGGGVATVPPLRRQNAMTGPLTPEPARKKACPRAPVKRVNPTDNGGGAVPKLKRQKAMTGQKRRKPIRRQPQSEQHQNRFTDEEGRFYLFPAFLSELQEAERKAPRTPDQPVRKKGCPGAPKKRGRR